MPCARALATSFTPHLPSATNLHPRLANQEKKKKTVEIAADARSSTVERDSKSCYLPCQVLQELVLGIYKYNKIKPWTVSRRP